METLHPTPFTLLGLDAIGDELEDSFGFDENDLPCDAILRTLERSALEPLDYVLT